MKQKELDQRYKKLKQSDRMEYLAIDSVYRDRDNTYTMIYFLSLSIKLFIMMMLLFTLFSAVNVAADIKGVERMQISDFGEGFFETTLGEFLGAFLFSILLLFIELSMLLLSIINNRARNKTLDEFLTERKV